MSNGLGISCGDWKHSWRDDVRRVLARDCGLSKAVEGMNVPEPSIKLEQVDGFVRVNMTYPQDFIIELARRAEENICDEVLARLGYVKPVRCRECKHATLDHTDHDYRETLRCCFHCMDVSPDRYCAWGVRKEDE